MKKFRAYFFPFVFLTVFAIIFAGCGGGGGSSTPSGNTNNNTESLKLSINSNGVVTIQGDPTFHGVMSTDKDTIVAVMSENNNTTFDIMVFQKSGGTTFSSSDLDGTWYMHALWSGNSNGWAYGSANISNGNANLTITRSDGSNSTISLTPIINSNGVVTIQGDPTFHGVMSTDKDTIVAVMSENNNTTFDIMVFQKSGGTTFSSSDLDGTWYMHALWSGNSNGWAYGSANISNGNANLTITRSDGSNSTISLTPIINSNGVVTIQGDPTFHGVMSTDKDTIVAVMSENNNTTFDIMVFQKSGGTTFSSSDLDGTWYMHALWSGNSNGWAYGILAVNNGIGTFISLNRSN
jgi:precorrin-6B methylase 1